MQSKIAASYLILHRAIEEYEPTHVFALFSGGHDSLCASSIAADHEAFSGVIHINTGIGFEQTRDYARKTSADKRWNYHEYHPDDTYEDLVRDQGFPGPAHHWKMYQRLKERALRKVLRDFREQRNSKLMFVSGRRRHESTRRMVNIDKPIETNQEPSGRIVWVNPIVNWRTENKEEFMKLRNLPRNPIVDKICMSGECMCGAFAKPEERALIKHVDPELDQRISELEDELLTKGEPRCVWGKKVVINDIKGQQLLPLCTSCQQNVAEEDNTPLA